MSSTGTREAHPAPALEGLSALAARSFGSVEETTGALLKLVADQLGMRTSYLTRITQTESLIEVLATYRAPGGPDIHPGVQIPLPTTYCSEVAGLAIPVPVLIENTHASTIATQQALAAASADIGSYIGVPIMLSGDQLYGTLCAVDCGPTQLSRQQTDLLVVLARILATQIERDQELHERLRAEAALRESEERYRALVHHAPDTISVISGGQILYINPAGVRLLGATSAEELIGRSIFDFAHPDSAGELRALAHEVRDEGRYVGPAEARLLRLDGTAAPVEITAIPILYQGRPAGQVLARDISRRKRAEASLAAALEEQRQANAQLERLSAAKSHFVSIVSHEFRTALTGIQGFSELLRDEEFSPEEVKEYAPDINEDAKRLNRMIAEILDLDRMESGRMTLSLRPVNLNALIADVAEQTRRASPRHPVELQLDPTLHPVAGDRDKLIQVLSNLLANAVKYSPEGGAITIVSAQEEGAARVSIRDRGVGIPHDELEQIFERYRRSEGGAARYLPGTGLGLPISRQIVELHGGRIWAESAPDEGAAFHFTVPLQG